MSALLKEKELREKLKVGRAFIHKNRMRGMPHMRIGEKCIRYDYDEVIRWLKTENQDREGK